MRKQQTTLLEEKTQGRSHRKGEFGPGPRGKGLGVEGIPEKKKPRSKDIGAHNG